MWDLVPWSGIEPGHPSWGAQSQPLDHRGGPMSLLMITCYKHFLKLEDKTRVSTNTASTSYCPLVGGGEQSRPQRPSTTPPTPPWQLFHLTTLFQSPLLKGPGAFWALVLLSYFTPQVSYSFTCWCFSSVRLLSHVWLFTTPWIAALQASLSITIFWSSIKLTSIELVIPSSHLILCRPLLLLPQSLLASESFPMSQLFAWGAQSTGVSALASFLPKNTQDWSPLEGTGWISLQSKGLSRVFSNTTVQKHQFFGAQLSSQSNSHIHTWPPEKP